MYHRMAVAALALSLSLVGVQEASAQRSGFIIGFGLGLGTTTTSVSGFDSNTELGVGSDFKIGAQVGQSLQVYYLNRANFYAPDGVDFVIASLSGVGVTYVLPSAPVHLSGGIGVSTFAAFLNGESDSVTGFGFTGGVGYEFADLWILDVAVTYGQPDDNLDMILFRAGISILSH